MIAENEPYEQIENSTIQFVFNKRQRVYTIYLITLIAFIAGLISLPFICVDIFSSSPGIINPIENRSIIYPPIGAQVDKVLVQEGSFIKNGSTILVLMDAQAEDQLLHLKRQQRKELKYIQDLTQLLSDNFSYQHLNTSFYRQSYLDYATRINNWNTQIAKSALEYSRANILYETRVSSKSDWEQADFNLRSLKDKKLQEIENQKLDWQNQLEDHKNKLTDLEANIKTQHLRLSQLSIKAPISGSVTNLSGVQKGVWVFPTQKLLEIIPQGTQVADITVSPTDIGYIYLGQPVRFQLHTYNYTEWGFANGVVAQIGQDAILVNGVPCFKVRCRLREEALYLKNGAVGKLSKGMTLTARFRLARRSIAQLLFDNISDWVTPTQPVVPTQSMAEASNAQNG